MTFKEFQKEYFNYECITTFWDDFTFAELFGKAGVTDLFNNAFKEWKHNYKYLTELVIVLNHRCWMHHNKGNEALSQVYADFYHKANNYALGHLKGKEADYYFQITD